MKKIFKGLICAGLVGAIAAGTLGAAGCKKDSHRDPESSPLRLAIGACDEKFNPLYYTSQNDGIIANMTQISLITADAGGKLTVGENQPTVALDYLETYYNAEGVALATGNGREVNALPGGNVNGDVNGSTTYEFLIKNDVKFSDGVDLTVMDVLFNLYVYLDPLYSGSNTIYSTKIKGLQAYRQNLPGAGEDTNLSTTEFYIKAQERVNQLILWSEGEIEIDLNDKEAQTTKDYKTVTELYEKELTADWNSIVTSWSETYKDYYFTEAWQAFYFMEQAFEEQKRPNDNGVLVRFKDENGKYPTELDPDVKTGEISLRGQMLISAMQDECTEAKIDEYIAANPGTDRANAKLTLQRNYAIKYLHTSNTGRSNIKNILRYNTTASSAVEAFMQDEITNAQKGKEQLVKNIEGITVSRSNQFNGKTYDEEHDILKIEIVGVDPKAKWNFGFTVSPMHYYSGTFEGKNYVQEAMTQYENGTVYTENATEFGVKYSDVNFINNVLANDSKNGVPVGAGAYKCCTYNYSSTGVDSHSFFYNYMAFFERNTYFETVGEEIENAKIKYVTYKVTNDDMIVSSLLTGEIDYGEPIAKSDNQTACRSLSQITYETGGYGYVGINPKYVPDIEVRQAIMMAFDTADIIEYYGDSLVNVINRPMSNTSWVWNYVDQPKTPYYTPAETAQNIIDHIESNGGWRFRNGSWIHEDGRRGLSFNFVIAGESTDHPAYAMFTHAKNFLEEAGFSISVGTDLKALQKLVTGDLSVWAAAWSSSIDPDPYQIYSIYSNASSTKNWNKDGIVSDGGVKFPKEYAIANEINERIIAGRQTLSERRRSEIYGKSEGDSMEDLCALDLIMELAVEFPTYQRYDLCVFNGNVLDRSTMTEKPSHNMGPISELWKVAYL